MKLALIMQIGLIGLGKMGYNLALNLRNHGHELSWHMTALRN